MQFQLQEINLWLEVSVLDNDRVVLLELSKEVDAPHL